MKPHVPPLAGLTGDDWRAHEVAREAWVRGGCRQDYLLHLKQARRDIALERAAEAGRIEADRLRWRAVAGEAVTAPGIPAAPRRLEDEQLARLGRRALALGAVVSAVLVACYLVRIN